MHAYCQNHSMQFLPAGVTFFERGWLSSNNVLLQDANQAILIDSGYWRHAEQTHALVASALHQQPLTMLINTHLHSDHCGGNAHLQAIYPALKTFIPPGHAEFVDTWNAQVLTYEPTGQHCPTFIRTGSLHDGDSVVVNNTTWRIHAAPGHDPHSIVIFNEMDGVLVSADALWENGFGVVFPEIEGFSAFDEVESTLDVIEELNPKLVLPGHGSVFADVSDAITRARSRLEQFRRSPKKHASYAAKVLLKFKLLEFQKIKLSDFLFWSDSVQYLKLLFARHGVAQSFEAWFFDQCLSLEKSSACTIDGEYIINVN
jgi:glyoxylase-like metal-dependent hydrolase (beta-lactamase superfamily II)